MDPKLLAVCLALCFKGAVAPGAGAHHHEPPNCLRNHCDINHVDLAECALAIDNDWQCHDNEFCGIRMDDHGVDMHCIDHNRFEDCANERLQNPRRCNLSSGHIGYEFCMYCCSDKACLQGLLTAPATAATASVTMPAATQGLQINAVSHSSSVPGINSCYTSSCHHGDDLATCTSGQYACQPGQFCHLHTDGEIHMSCESDSENDRHLLDCLIEQSHNTASCSHYVPGPPCHHCCHDHSCVDSLLQPASAPPPEVPHDYRPGRDSCFTSDCDHHANLDVCTSGHWACRPDEICRFDADKNGDTRMHCVPHGEMEHCQRDEHQNRYSCYPLTDIPEETCHYCCFDAACIHGVTGQSTANPQVTGSPQFSTQQAVTAPPIPGKNSCFSTDCIHHSTMAYCISGQWACHNDEFCQFNVVKNGDIHMHCAKDLSHCHDEQSHNGPWCNSLTSDPDEDCHFCCHDATCVRGITGITNPTQATTLQPTTVTPTQQAVTTAPAPQTTSTQQVTSVHPHTPGHNSCFTTDCHGHASLFTCILGEYACKQDEYCKFEAHSDGGIRMHCAKLGSLGHCLLEELSDSVHCFPANHVPPHSCYYCCMSAECIRVIVGINDPTAPPPAVTMSTQTATASHITSAATAATSLPPSAHTTPPHTDCRDLYSGDCSVDFAGRCSEKAIQIACPDTCGTCHETCTDLYLGDCSTVFAGQCGDQTVNELCRKTCHNCSVTASAVQTPSATTAGIVASTTPRTTVEWVHCIDHYVGNCSKYLPGGCTSPLVAAVCEKTCGLCTAPSNVTTQATKTGTTVPTTPTIPSTSMTSTTTTTTTTTTAAPVSNIRCVVCGDRASRTPCTDIELLMNMPEPCGDPSEKFCMTDIEVDDNSNIATYKRCVNKDICIRDWYRQTSDKVNCLTFDPLVAPSHLVCHFCCVDNGCNLDIVPDPASQWRP